MMIPTPANLITLIGKTISLDIRLGARAPNILDGVIVKEYGFSISLEQEKVTLKREDGVDNNGLWVPYVEGQAVVGYASGQQTWIASGPFSGCEFAVGKGGGRVFGAHIARQSGSTAQEDYKKYRSDNALQEWYWNKIPMPESQGMACSYVFVILGGGGITSMARIDVAVTSMGGGNGKIMSVRTLKS
jgi:hypothetical protein